MNIFQDSGTDITKFTKQNYFMSAVSYLTQNYLSLDYPDWTFAFVFAKWIFASNSVFSGSFVLSLYSPAVISDVSGCTWYRCFSWNKQRYGNASVGQLVTLKNKELYLLCIQPSIFIIVIYLSRKFRADRTCSLLHIACALIPDVGARSWLGQI